MNKLLLTLLFSLTGTALIYAQENTADSYFYDLRGMEDSLGMTHLFYRMQEKRDFQCSENDQEITSFYDNIYHVNLASSSDSLLFRDFYSPWCLDGIADERRIQDYVFYDEPNKWLTLVINEYSQELTHFQSKRLELKIPIIVKTPNKLNTKYSASSYFLNSLMLSPNADSLYVITSSDETIPFPGKAHNWPEFTNYDAFLDYADSLSIPRKISAIHPNADSLYFSIDSSKHLYRSDSYSANFQLTDSSAAHHQLAFDADNAILYSLGLIPGEGQYIVVSDQFGTKDSWDLRALPETNSSFEFFQTDKEKTGEIYLADSVNVIYSRSYGEQFSNLLSIEEQITGLYKKPGSDLLYVLTTEELLEVNVATDDVSSLKQLPVFNEPEPEEIPAQTELHQNYPNPFNPSTTIRYQLHESGYVTLEVYDITGKKVASLVNNNLQSAGTHRVRFDANNLASGLYLYRLKTGDQTIIQKMLLMK